MTGFRFQVIQRTVAYGANGNHTYTDVVVDGSDYYVNASRFAAEWRAKGLIGCIYIIK